MTAWGKGLVERQEHSGREIGEIAAVLQENDVFREFSSNGGKEGLQWEKVIRIHSIR